MICDPGSGRYGAPQTMWSFESIKKEGNKNPLFLYNRGMWLHRLSNKNLTARTADCTYCGPSVKLANKGNGKFRCANADIQRNGVRKKYVDPHAATRPAVCEICGSDKRICYDHDHTTGKHRGWLCDNCNKALGHVRDNAATLRALADYLEK